MGSRWVTIRTFMPRRFLFTVLCTFALATTVAEAQFPVACDRWRQCLGRAVRFTETEGRNAHFIEISGQVTAPRQTALTVEMWVRVNQQAGKRQFVAGLWGPNTDVNDQWLLYISENDDLTFEINGDGTTLGQIDNTVASAPFGQHYGTWTHIAAVFDGPTASASVYINGLLVAGPVANPTYPSNYLKPLERNDLQTLIASCNAVADNGNLYRTLDGMVDEVRIWSRAKDANEILCDREFSFVGNEQGLEVYFRCNEPVNNVVSICDASGNGRTGLLRSGASNQNSGRTLPRYVTVTPSSITHELKCDTTFTWTFTVVDTSVCGSSVRTRMRGPEAGSFTATPRDLVLQPGVPQTITVTYTGTNVGSFLDTLQVLPRNRCGYTRNIPLNITRTTEISLDRGSILYDTLLVGCRDVPFHDSTVRICNTTEELGAPRTVTISNITTNEPQGFEVIGVSFPFQLAPGQCTTITVRSWTRDTTDDYMDTLRIFSDDRCQSVPAIVTLEGRTQEVISITNPGGTARIDTMRFQPTCPGQLSAPRYYVWQNLTLSPLQIDTMIFPPDITHYRVDLPFDLDPATGYPPLAVRFRPRSPGRVFDSVIIRTKVNDCTIERIIYISGRGLDNKVEWELEGPIDFGNVIVGQQRTINVKAYNNSDLDPLNVALYVERGDAFELLAGTGRRINPQDSVEIPVTFRPTDSLRYNDRLCLFETRCYTVDCIDITGKGVLERFRFSPLVAELQNVVACRSGLDTVCIVNISGSAQTITNMSFRNPSGRYSFVDPPALPTSATIPANDSLCFVVEYTPNDVTQDRADRAYIEYESDDGAEWQVQLIGTSATPKIFVTQFTAFGTVEVGDVATATLTVENTSSLSVELDSLTIGAGFNIISTSRPLPLTLAPRDSISVVVEFRPDASRTYDAKLTAYSDLPCEIRGEGDLNGRGVIIELENALTLVNFGYVRPCECAERTIELLNGSLVFDMSVDSLWIDAQGLPNGQPQFFSWTSKFSPNGTVPYAIPPEERDTVTIKFCPDTPADSTTTQVEALLHVQASGSQWSAELETFLIGKRSLTFNPWPRWAIFPAGVVDVLSPATRTIQLSIPAFDVNPSQDTVQVDSITFEPDERVFFVQAPAAFPVTLAPGETLDIDFKQRPRAPRVYEAKMIIHYSKPCPGRDTTVFVRGEGFAQPRGLEFSFDPPRDLPDTFAMVSCDTLTVPVYSSIEIDASVVDVFMRVDFDSSQVRLLDIQSPLLSNQCESTTGGIIYTPDVQTAPSPWGGIDVTLKNFCGIDSLNAFAIMRFVTVNNNRVDSRLTIDSINFDTEDVILYKLIATGDRGTILAFQSEITVFDTTAFDSVRILECADREIVVHNTGEVGNTLDQLLDLPEFTTIVSSVPPFGDTVGVGDSAIVTVRFCPRAERSIDTMTIAVSSSPCEVRDTAAVTGYGYAPELDVAVGAMEVFFVPDTITGTIGDIIEIPIMIDRDVSATYNSIDYWLNALDVTIDMTYQPRSLKYLEPTFLAKPDEMTVNASLGAIQIVGENMDTLEAGEVARLAFLVTVPEFAETDIDVQASGFTSDSLQFLDIVPSGNVSPFITSGECNITVVNFTTTGTPKIDVYPNPASGDATISFRMQERVPVSLVIFDGTGTVVRTLMQGETRLVGGEYDVNFSTSDLPAGLYHVRIMAGVFTDVVPFVIVK